MGGAGTMSISALMVVIGYMGAVYGPLSSIAHTTGQLQGAIKQLRQFIALQLAPPSVLLSTS